MQRSTGRGTGPLGFIRSVLMSISSRLDDRSRNSEPAKLWRRWLVAFASTVLLLGSGVYVAVIFADPYATGRTPFRSAILASINPRLLKAGIVRDPQFNAAIFGSSTGYPIDPELVGSPTGWRVAQLAIPAALPPHQLVVARTYQKSHAGLDTLQVYVLDRLWCRAGDPLAGGWGSFPTWVYEGSTLTYLSRILFPDAVATAVRRIGILAGFAEPAARNDGFVNPKSAWLPRIRLAALSRPVQASEDESFPALDLLAEHIAALPPSVRVMLVFAPPYINTLPVERSPAARRLNACKIAAQTILARRQLTAFLDLMTENAISADERGFFDEVHYTSETAVIVAAAIVGVIKENRLLAQ